MVQGTSNLDSRSSFCHKLYAMKSKCRSEGCWMIDKLKKIHKQLKDIYTKLLQLHLILLSIRVGSDQVLEIFFSQQTAQGIHEQIFINFRIPSRWPKSSVLIMLLLLYYTTSILMRLLLELSNFVTNYTKILCFLQCNLLFCSFVLLFNTWLLCVYCNPGTSLRGHSGE